MSTYERAPKEIPTLIGKVLREHYEELHGLFKEKGRFPLTFDALFVRADRDGKGEPVGDPLKSQGRVAAATIQQTPKQDRALGRADITIKIDADKWDKMEDNQREALIDHELHHLILRRKDGLPYRDDLGRLTFTMREHDYDLWGFVAIAKRRGLASAEVRNAKALMHEHGQHLFMFAEQGEIVPAEPAEA